MKKLKLIKLTQEIKDKIIILIEQELSPEQVCIYLKDNNIIDLHHETAYRFVMKDKHNGGVLHTNLRHTENAVVITKSVAKLKMPPVLNSTQR